MQGPPIIKHIRDILRLPFTVTVIIPYLVYDKQRALFNANIFLKVMGIILAICGLILFPWAVPLILNKPAFTAWIYSLTGFCWQGFCNHRYFIV